MTLPWTEKDKNGVCSSCDGAIFSLDFQTHIRWYHKDASYDVACDAGYDIQPKRS